MDTIDVVLSHYTVAVALAAVVVLVSFTLWSGSGGSPQGSV